jgi:hypothetical protein
MARTTRVYSVNGIQLALTKSNPPELLITAAGTVVSTGWNDIALVPLEQELSPDGILDLAFVGTPPEEVFVAYPVQAVAHHVWKDAEKIVGVKVHARTNELTRLLIEHGIGGHGGITSLVFGEESPPAAQIAGETQGGRPWPTPTVDAIGAKTFAAGEEHLSTLAVGEEHQPPITTLVFGEEGHPPTTLIAGEEGPTHFLGETPTFYSGEHGPSLPIAEHPSIFVAEHWSAPGGEQFKPQPDPWGNVALGGINAFGTR